MDTLNINNAWMGSTNVTAMWLSGSKVWPQSSAGIYDLRIEGYSGSLSDFTTNRIQGIGGTATYNITSYTVTGMTASVVFGSGSQYEFRGLSTFTTNGVFAPYVLTALVDSGACRAVGRYSIGPARFLRQLALPGITTHESSFNELFRISSLNLNGLVTGSGTYGMSGLGNQSTGSNAFPTASFPSLQIIQGGLAGIADGGRYEHFGTNIPSRFYSFPELHTISASGTFANNRGISGIYAPKLRNITSSIFVGADTGNGANTGSLARTASLWINSAVTASIHWNTTRNLHLLQSQSWNIFYVNG